LAPRCKKSRQICLAAGRTRSPSFVFPRASAFHNAATVNSNVHLTFAPTPARACCVPRTNTIFHPHDTNSAAFTSTARPVGCKPPRGPGRGLDAQQVAARQRGGLALLPGASVCPVTCLGARIKQLPLPSIWGACVRLPYLQSPLATPAIATEPASPATPKTRVFHGLSIWWWFPLPEHCGLLFSVCVCLGGGAVRLVA